MSKPLPNSINLLEPMNPPQDIWEKVYRWIFGIGRYLLISVMVVVLAVFGIRFSYDRRNNDLADEINVKVATLNEPFFRQNEIKFNNLHKLLIDVNQVTKQQAVNSKIVSAVLDSIPSSVELKRFSFSRDRVNMSFTADTFEQIKNYETLLRSNSLYEDVKVNLTKSGDTSTKIDFNVTFIVKLDQEQGPATPPPVTEGVESSQSN